MTKACTKCGVEKPLDDFSKHKLGAHGRRPRCRVCTAEENAAYRAKNQPRIKSYNATYRDEHRDELRAKGRDYMREKRGTSPDFVRKERVEQKAVRRRAMERDPEKVRASKRAWRLANPEKVRAHKRAHHRRHREEIVARVDAWRKANPEMKRAQSLKRRSLQAGAAGADYTTAEHIQARVDLYGGRCYYCGAPWEAIDHRIPLARGGSHWPANLVPACRSCNSRKHARPELEFRAIAA